VPFVTAAGHRLEYRWIGAPPRDAATLVFLHEGLGSVSVWRDFPEAVCQRTGRGALVYSRYGHGASDALEEPRGVRFMHDEARVVPELIRAFAVTRPILIGHSDGASIAIIYAGSGLGPIDGLVLEAPHVFVEDISIESISRIKTAYETTDLKEKLARHHGSKADAVFRAWNDVWLLQDFRSWNIEEYLPVIRCPVLVLQGRDDEYGTGRQVEAIAAQVGDGFEALLLDECGHAPHVDQRPIVEEAMTRFIQAIHA
jgi:pimeloyl-ACP methyl ester carboxylesterase